MRASTIMASLPLALVGLLPLHAQEVLTGEAAFGTWEKDAPGIRRHITPADLPPPTLTENDPEAPDFERYPLARQATMIEVIVQPGDMLYVPAGWYHQVRALTFSLSSNRWARSRSCTLGLQRCKRCASVARCRRSLVR